MSVNSKRYKNEIAAHLAVREEQIFLYWKGRVGLYAILKAMGVKNGDEVILQAFTCVVVPNAVIYTEASPIYVDIDKKTLNTTLEKIKKKITDHTKCIIIQNTFGLSSEVEEIVAFAKEKGVFTIEDCTHGFGGTYDGRPNGTFCDTAFYSSQWNKPFSTGIGGIALINNSNLIKEIRKVNEDLISPTFSQNLQLFFLIKARKYLLNGITYWSLLKLYRFLSKKGWVIGSSESKEITSIDIPEKYFMGGANVQFKQGVKSLNKLDDQLKLRKDNALRYHEFLKEHQKYHYPDAVLNNHSFLKYPIFVKDREAFKKSAEKSKIPLGDWFESMLHPVQQDLSLWNLHAEDFPNAQFAAQHILNLPTGFKSSEKVLRFLKQNIEELL